MKRLILMVILCISSAFCADSANSANSAISANSADTANSTNSTNVIASEQSAPWSELAAASRLAKDDPTAARIALEQIVLANPHFAPARFNLGTLLLATDPAKAAEQLQAALDYPGSALVADAWHNLALARWKMGQLEPALAAAEQALTRQPDFADFIHTRDELRRAWLIQQNDLRLKKEAEAKKLRLGTTELPIAREGYPYQATLTALGGTPDYRFAAENLPAGLTLATDGTLSGTPGAETKGSHTLAITLTDHTDTAVRGEPKLTILPTPAILTAVLPEAIIQRPYQTQVACQGFVQPQWSTQGLPPGLSLSPTGGIAGTPTEQGTFTVTFTVHEAHEPAITVERSVPLIISDSFIPTPTILPPATAWAAYEHRLGVLGPPLQFVFSNAGPTEGLALAADGRISGTPDKSGILSIPVTLTASDNRQRDAAVQLLVNPPPVIAEEEIITITRGQMVNRPLKVEGGTAPFTWVSTGGPQGVRVDPDGSLRGAATTVGEQKMIITATDRWQATATVNVTIKVQEADNQDQQDEKNDKQDEQDSQEKQDQQGKDQQQKQDQQDQSQGQDQQDPNKPGQDQQGQPDKQQDPSQPPGQDPSGDKGDKNDTGDKAKKPDDQSAEQGKTGAELSPQNQGNQAEAQAGPQLDMSKEAADRWMEQLPSEDRDVLRLQLLHDSAPPATTKDPW